MTCVAYDIVSSDIVPEIRACPRAKKQGRAKCRRQHHRSVGPNTGRNPEEGRKKHLLLYCQKNYTQEKTENILR